MAYQALLNNRSHKPSLQNWFFPPLSATKVTNTSSSSIPPSPDGVESTLTSSDSGTDSTFSFTTPTSNFGPDSFEADLPPTMSFGDLGGFKSYPGNEAGNKDVINGSANGSTWTSPSPSTPSYPNSANGQSNQLANTTNHMNSSANVSSPTYMIQQQHEFDYNNNNNNNNYSFGSAVVGPEESSMTTTMTAVRSTTATPSTSTTPFFSPEVTPTPPPPASSFQFSFRMTPPQTDLQNQNQSQGQAQKGRRKAQSPNAQAQVSPSVNLPQHSPVSAVSAGGPSSSSSASKPVTLQFNTRNGQAVLSLSTPAREAAALKERMKKEKFERSVSGGGDGAGCKMNGSGGGGGGGDAQVGSRGKEMSGREDHWTWRNIKPAPPAAKSYSDSTSSAASTSAMVADPPVTSVALESQMAASGSAMAALRPAQVLMHPSEMQQPELQQYHNAYVPYDMYEELIHGTIGSAKVAQQQQQQSSSSSNQQPALQMGETMGHSAALERTQMQASLQNQIQQKQVQARITQTPATLSQSRNQGAPQNPVHARNSSQVPQQQQHFQSQFQLGNTYPHSSSSSSSSASTSTPVSASTFSSPTHDLGVSANLSARGVPGSQQGYPYSLTRPGTQVGENQAMSMGDERWEQRQNFLQQGQYHGSQGGQIMQSGHINNIAGAHPRSHHPNPQLPPQQQQQQQQQQPPAHPPLTLFRRPNGACTRCKRMKMKCVVPTLPNGAAGGLHVIPESEADLSTGPSPHPLPPSLACTRCAAANQPCIVEGRKPRTPSQREALLSSIRQKDAIIATLLAPYQPSEQNANIVLNGAKVIEALDKGKGKAVDDEGVGSASSIPPETSASGEIIGPVERAALLANDKGVSTKEGRLGYGKNKFTLRKRLDTAANANANVNSSDEDSVSSDNSDFDDSEEDDIWDGEVERGLSGRGVVAKSAFHDSSRNTTPAQTGGEENSVAESEHGGTPGAAASHHSSRRRHTRSTLESQLMMHLHTLPPLDAPLGTIARLSLEGMGEKVKPRPRSSLGKERINVKVEGGSESVPSLVGQKRRRDAHDAGDEERDSLSEDEDDDDDGNEKYSSNAAVEGSEEDDADEDDAEGSVAALADPQSITLTDAQSLSLSSLVITESDGPAHRSYFAPGLVSNLPLRRIINARAPAPPILSSGLVTWEECAALFDIYYEYVHAYCSVLDPVLHTVQTVYERDPFLFTVILAVSSRYYTARPGLYKVAMHYAKAAAATAFVNGIKSIEMVQAYLIMCTYGLPARRWEEDRSWFYGGLAFRIATDLNLDKSFDDYKMETKMGSLTGPTNSLSERQEREKLNRMRTWLNCFNVDRSSSTQWGKPTALVEGDPIRKAREWWRCSLYNHPYDLHLVAYTELLRIVSRFHEQVYSDPMSKTGLNKNANFQKITEQIEANIKDWHDNTRWSYDRATTKSSSNSSSRSSTASPSHPSPSPAPTLGSANKRRTSISSSILFNAFSCRRAPPMADLESDPALIVRIEGVPVFENYMRLVMYSFGFEQAWRRWKARRSKSHKMDVDKNVMLTMGMDLDLDGGDMFFLKCLNSASAVVRHLSDVYGPSGYLKYAPDCFFVMGGFCAAFLLKMLRPAFASLLDEMRRERVIQVVTRFMDVLDSPAASIDATHTPRLYAKFLRGAMRDVVKSRPSADEKKAYSSSDDVAIAMAMKDQQVPTQNQTQTPALTPGTSANPMAALLSDTASMHLLSPSASTASPFEAPSLSFSHTQTPRSGSEDCMTPNDPSSTVSARKDGNASHTGMGINPALTVSSSLKGQQENSSGHSGASTPLADMSAPASSTPTPTLSPALANIPGSNSDSNGIGHALGMTPRWRPSTGMEQGGFAGYPSQAHGPLQQQSEHQNWPHTAVRNATGGDLGIVLGAAVMAGVDSSSGVGEGYAYNEYMNSNSGLPSQAHGQYGTYSQYQMQNSYHQHGSSSWGSQLFPTFFTEQNTSSASLQPPPLTSMSMPSMSMDLSEDEFLATMHAVSSDNWNSSVIMPGYGWGPDNDEDIGMGDV